MSRSTHAVLRPTLPYERERADRLDRQHQQRLDMQSMDTVVLALLRVICGGELTEQEGRVLARDPRIQASMHRIGGEAVRRHQREKSERK